jgi:competence protein ComEC
MKRISLVVLLLAGPALAQLSEPYKVRDSVTDCVNVRVEHDNESESIDCLIAGTPVTVIDTAPYWRKVVFGSDQQGWIGKKFIERISIPSDAPDGLIPSDAFLEVHFVDVGQGDAIWIQTHDDGIDGNGRFEGYSIVIDGGPYSADNDNPFSEYIEAIGHHGADVEALIVTHPHTDHYRGAETISRHFDINHYYDPGYPGEKVGYLAFLGAMRGTADNPPRAANLHIGIDNFGTPDWGSEIDAEFLYGWPGSSDGLGTRDNTIENNSSIVLRLQYGQHVFLFMGDAEGKDRDDDPDPPQYVEKILLDTVPQKLKATVLKIAHHGSETSSTTKFIEAVDPEVVVVESGRHPFGGTFLPDSTTLQRYCDHNEDIRIYRTDQNDEAAGLLEKHAVDADHIVIRTNGSGDLQLKALDGGADFEVDECQTD